MAVARKKKKIGNDHVVATWQSHATTYWQLRLLRQTRKKWGWCPLFQSVCKASPPQTAATEKMEVVTKCKQNVHFNSFQQGKPTERDDPPRSDAF